jgi:hypothetical protein
MLRLERIDREMQFETHEAAASDEAPQILDEDSRCKYESTTRALLTFSYPKRILFILPQHKKSHSKFFILVKINA